MILKRLVSLLWWFTVMVVIGLAVMLSAARLLLPGMSEYRVQIEAVASNFVDRRVQIGALDAAWQGLSPILKLQQVAVYGEEFAGGSLAVQEVHLTLDLLESLVQRQWSTSQLRVIGTRLGFSTAGSGSAGGRRAVDPLGWLLQQKSIVLDDVSIDWTDERWFAGTLQLRDVSLRLINAGSRHHLALETRLAQYPDNEIVVMADMTGPGYDPAAWHGKMYLRTHGLELDAATRLLDRFGLSARGRVDLEVWAGVDRGRLDWGSGSMAVEQGVLQMDGGSGAGFGVERLDSAFRWQAVADGWKIALHEFAYQREQRSVWPASRLSLIVNRDETLRLRGSASLLVIDELRGVLPLLPWVEGGALTMIDRLQPTGQLRDVEFDLEFPPASAPRFSARAHFDELAVAASGGLPGMTGMSGRIEGNLQSGFLYLDSAGSSLRMPALFSQAIDLSQLAGTVHWQRYADSFRIESQAMEVASGALAATARLQMDWPYRAASPWIDLQVMGASLPLDQVRHYLPDRVMSPAATAWLLEALDSGTARNLRFLLQGRVDQIPFDARQGRLEARFDFEDMLLDYHPRWGQLHATHGSALFQGRSMVITATQGRIQTSPLRQVVASIEDLARPVLKIDGALDGALSGMLDYVAGSPLGERFGAAIQQFDSGGDAQLQLALRIPLKRDLGATTVKGNVELDGNSLTRRSGMIAFTDIKGQLRFTHNGISAKKLTARLLGSPVVASIYRQSADAGGETLVDMQGRPDLVAALAAEQPALDGYIDGKASWRALLKIPNRHDSAGSNVQLQLQSDLVGIAIDLPEPFDKPATVPRNLSVNWVPDTQSNQPVLVSYGDLVDARLLPTADRSGIDKADVRFGGGTAQLPEQPGIRIAGQLEQLDLDGWLDVYRALSAARAGQATSAPLPPASVHLALMNFLIFGHQVQDLRVDGETGDAWQFSLQGEGAAGTLHWTPAGAARPAILKLALDHLLLKRDEHGGEESAVRDLSQPAALPELNISVTELVYAGRQLGKVEVSGKPGVDGFEFETLAMRSDAITLAGKGSWSQLGDRRHTHFEADVKGGKLEDLSRMYTDSSAVQGGKLTGRVELNWRGDPAQFSLATVEGDLYLKARDGRLVHVDEGAGKLLNLISLNSLQRRLSLDFSDVTREGFSFDVLEGRFVLVDGDAFTNDFRIEGSSAIISIAGRTGLIARDYDQLVTVTPQVSSGLPIAGAIAGGPAVGAAVFLAEKLVGKEFNRMTELQYLVTGSWEEPVYERLQKSP